MPNGCQTFIEAARAMFVKRFGFGDTPVGRGFDNNVALNWRNAANSVDVEALLLDADNRILLGSEALLPFVHTEVFTLDTNGSLATQGFFIADRPYIVVGITEIHKTAGTHGSPVTLAISKDTGAAAPGAGVSLMSGTFNAKGAANTLQTATLSLTAANLSLAVGDRLSAVFAGTLTALAGVQITVAMIPGGKSHTAIYSMNANGDLVTQAFFIANRPMAVAAVYEIHSAAGTNGSAVTIDVTHETTTGAPGAGSTVLAAAFNAKGAANTRQTGALSATAADLILSPGDRLSVKFTGTLTDLAGVVIVAVLTQGNGEKELVYNLSKNANLITQSIFTADRDYEVLEVSEVHAVAGNDGSAVTLAVTCDIGTAAPGAGTSVMTSTFNLKATANTIQWDAGAARHLRFLRAGDRLSVKFVGALATLAGVVVTVSLAPR